MEASKLRIGEIVHYVLSEGDQTCCPGEHRPAIVVKVAEEGARVQLQVFTDGVNDRPFEEQALLGQDAVPYDAAGSPGSWHWPERE